jgi:hypothetical protein
MLKMAAHVKLNCLFYKSNLKISLWCINKIQTIIAKIKNKKKWEGNVLLKKYYTVYYYIIYRPRYNIISFRFESKVTRLTSHIHVILWWPKNWSTTNILSESVILYVYTHLITILLLELFILVKKGKLHKYFHNNFFF